MRTIVFAYHEIGAAALRATLRNGMDVVAVFTHRDDPNEGGWYASVARLAAEHGIPVHAPDKLDHPIWIERIKAMKPELLLSYHYRNLIPKAVRGMFPAGCMNLHSSLLPKHRGRCPINWVLVLGEKETGVTLHHMADKADAGDIIAQRRVAIAADADARSLTYQMARESEALLDEALPLVKAGKAPRTPQDESKATVNGRRTAEDGAIDWTSQPKRCTTWCARSPIRGRARSPSRARARCSCGRPRWPTARAIRARCFQPTRSPWPAAAVRWRSCRARAPTACGPAASSWPAR